MGQSTGVQTKGSAPVKGVFGDRLRREREMRGITLEEISESTKISRRHLEALESDKFEQLPSGVFAKGFIRAYAHFLGIDEDQAVADYALARNEQPEPEDKFPLEIHEEPEKKPKPRRSRMPLAFGIAALAGVLVGYGFWVKSRPHTSGTAEAPQTTAASAAGSSVAASATNNTPADTAETKNTHQAVSPVQHTSSPVTAPVANPESQDQQSQETAKKPAEKRFSLMVKANQDSWVSIVADGKSVMQRVLIADKQKLVKAGKQVVLRTGNAGGIQVSFNGRPLGILGNENEPRTLTFNATGLVQ